MSDVTIKYNGTSIATMDTSGTKTLTTAGKYCAANVAVEYTDPEKPTQTKSATPSLSSQNITPDSGYVLSSVDVAPITSTILASLDADFSAMNIKKDVDLFGLIGDYEGGGGTSSSPSRKDINFLDYDGALVASWTLAELASASSLPVNPSHNGLTAQGWNWTLSDLKTENAPMNVGQMYITDDEKTRLYITIADPSRMDVSFGSTILDSIDATIDWGDNTPTENLSSDIVREHIYSHIGNYVITVTIPSGTLNFGYPSSSGIMGFYDDNNIVHCNMLKSIELGRGVVNIGANAFYNCQALSSITIPSGVSVIGDSAFCFCRSLTSITIPSGCSHLDDYAFYNCHSLASITIPSGIGIIGAGSFDGCAAITSMTIPSSVSIIGNNALQNCVLFASISIPSSIVSISSNMLTNCVSLALITISSGISSIGTNAFSGCRSLASVVIPSSVGTIGNYAFRYCEGVKDFYIYPTTPPTLGGTACFDNVASDAVLHVPAASLSTYQGFTNWSEYSSKMVGDL